MASKTFTLLLTEILVVDQTWWNNRHSSLSYNSLGASHILCEKTHDDVYTRLRSHLVFRTCIKPDVGGGGWGPSICCTLLREWDNKMKIYSKWSTNKGDYTKHQLTCDRPVGFEGKFHHKLLSPNPPHPCSRKHSRLTVKVELLLTLITLGHIRSKYRRIMRPHCFCDLTWKRTEILTEQVYQLRDLHYPLFLYPLNKWEQW